MNSTTAFESSLNRKAFRLLLKDCAAGLYQQMYFLGKDIMHARGNQLIQFGFVRSPSCGLKGTSCYTLETETVIVELYGSCACCYTDATRVAFLRNKTRFYHWLPEERCVAGLWTEEDIHAGSPESLFQATVPLLRWWLEYEAWILSRLGDAYREACFKEWRKVNKSKSWLPPQEAMRWVEAFLEQAGEHLRAKHFMIAGR